MAKHTLAWRTVAVVLLLVALLGFAACAPKKAPETVTDAPRLAQKPAAAADTTRNPINGELSTIGEGEDAITVLKLWGTPYEMGYAHGKLCADKIRAFYSRLLGAMTVGMGVQPEVVDAAWGQMEPYVGVEIREEMRGLAEGAGVDIKLVQRAHAVPDLSEFHCTFFAAWGKATKDGHLHQIRALDYETKAGIQDEPALIVFKPEGQNAFVEIGWVGFIGCISGMNDKHIALSEIGEHFSDEVETLAGEPMPLLMRRVLQQATTLDEAIAIFKDAHRTSSYLYCVGDAKIPDARALRTSRDFCEVFAPGDRGELSLDEVVYWSMGCDSSWNKKVYDVLKPRLGEIDENVGMQDVMKGLGTGDLHAVHYDATDLELWVANATPAPENAPAFTQNFLHFSLAEALK